MRLVYMLGSEQVLMACFKFKYQIFAVYWRGRDVQELQGRPCHVSAWGSVYDEGKLFSRIRPAKDKFSTQLKRSHEALLGPPLLCLRISSTGSNIGTTLCSLSNNTTSPECHPRQLPATRKNYRLPRVKYCSTQKVSPALYSITGKCYFVGFEVTRKGFIHRTTRLLKRSEAATQKNKCVITFI